MSSKIKVDTIENVAGSGNVSLGSGHNLVVPGNITGSGTASITGDLTVDTSTLKVDSSNNRVGIGTASPSQTLETAGNIFINTSGNPNLTVKTTGAGNNPFVRIQADTNYWDLQSIFSNPNDELDFRYNGTSTMMIDKNGHITKPLQSAFLARIQDGSAMLDVALNTELVVQINEEIYDQNSDYNTSNYTFTAPVTGKYQFNVRLYLLNVPSNTTYIYFQLVTSNRTYMLQINDVDSDQAYDFLGGSILADMDASDTAQVKFYQPNGSQTTHIHHGQTWFNGYLAC